MATRAANLVNPNAEVVSSSQCLQVNVAAARGLQSVVKTNLGPRGTLKMLVGGAGQIKITKDGNVLLHEMQIQHPTAMMIARAATAMDDEVGDGTTSAVLFAAELLKQAERYTSEGLHPRVLCEGYEIAKDMVLEFLEGYKHEKPNIYSDRQLLLDVARTSLRTKLNTHSADNMATAVVDAIMAVAVEDSPIDLHMVEIMTMQHKSGSDSQFVNGLVLDHGARHPDMPTHLTDVHILTLNVSMEYEKTEVSAGFYYSTAEERERYIESESRFTQEVVSKVIAFKRSVCDTSKGQSFAIVNQKGIDPLALDMLAKEGIFAVRRAKRRNMERLTLACGGSPVNSVEELTPDILGHAHTLREEALGDDRYTFIEGVRESRSCTILIRGPNKHTIDQIQDATRDGLRACMGALQDKALVPGAGSFELATHTMLHTRMCGVCGKAKLGVQAYAAAVCVVPKVLAENSGLDVQDTVIKVQEEQDRTHQAIGIDLHTGGTCLPAAAGIWDSYTVKKQTLNLATVLATQLLLVDEVMKAGKAMGKAGREIEEE